jgi:uncharacterized membrane protein YfcA
VTWPDALLLVAAGILAGLAGSIAGLASLFSYPALLAVGVPPLTANVTNTVALVFSSVGSTVGSRPELRDQHRRRLLTLLVTSVTGGIAGALLLLGTPDGSFEKAVPVLIALASLGVLAPRPHPDTVHPARHPRWLIPSVFAVGVYGGYFGAAAGTLMLALLLVATSDTLARVNAVKNLVVGVANAIAAVVFALTADVRWIAVPPLAAGLLAGAMIGPAVIRHTPVRPLRWVIALAGFGLAIHLAIDTYT